MIDWLIGLRSEWMVYAVIYLTGFVVASALGLLLAWLFGSWTPFFFCVVSYFVTIVVMFPLTLLNR